MSTTTSRTTEAHQSGLDQPIVVGVDPGGRCASAIVWAVEEAERHRSPLMLVSATSGRSSHADVGQHDLGTLARRLTMVEIGRRAVPGRAVDVLLDAAADDACTLVVGCRVMRATRRMAVGSTSRAVASWSPVPVVVVPEPWIQPSLATGPVVVGVRPADERESEEGATDHELLTSRQITRARSECRSWW